MLVISDEKKTFALFLCPLTLNSELAREKLQGIEIKKIHLNYFNTSCLFGSKFTFAFL